MPSETRTINWYGVLRPSEAALKARSIRLFCDILRNPSSPYSSEKTQPSESFYGYLTVVRNGYIVDKRAIIFEHQELWNADNLTELLNFERYWACRFQSGINYLKGLISAGAPDFVLADTGVFTSLRPNVDEFRVKLLTQDVVAKLTLVYEPLFTCLDDPTEQDPPPPEEPPVRPPGEDPPASSDNPVPLTLVDDPYDGDTDDGRTYPPPTPPEFPIGDACSVYTVTVSCVPATGGAPLTNSIVVFGEIGFVGFDTATGLVIYVRCRGDALAPGAFCRSSPIDINLLSSSGGWLTDTFEYTVT